MLRTAQVLALVFATHLAALSILVVPAEADACSWSMGVLEATLPEAGGEVPPDAELSVWFKPGGGMMDWEFELTDGQGESVDADVDVHQYGTEMGAVDHYRVIPSAPLEMGSHSLHVSSDQNEPEEFPLDFEVTDVGSEAPSAPENVDWTRIDEPPQSGECYGRSEQWNDIVVDDDRDDVWYEIDYETDGEDIVATHPGHSQFRHYVTEVADCFTIEAVGLDGTRSEAVERCEPDVCLVGDGADYLEEVDCEVDQQVSDDEEPACSAGSGAPGSLVWMLAVVATLFAIRRRQPGASVAVGSLDSIRG